VERELVRLRRSFELAKAGGYRRYILFLHYPPTNILEERSGFTDLAEEYGVFSIPCVVLMKDGAEADRSVGLVPKEQLVAMLQE